MDLGLKDKVAVVTGGSRGLGFYSARALAAEGARLAICARGEEGLEAAAAALRQAGTEVLPWPVTSPRRMAADTLLDVPSATTTAGSTSSSTMWAATAAGRFEETSDQDWLDIIELNVLAGFRASRGAIPMMRERGGGSIVFVSSVFGREKGGPGLSIYNTTKSALISAAGIMALELAKDGIRVNCVAPGSIRFAGGSWDKRVKADPDGMRAFVRANLPLGRFGEGGGGGGRGDVFGVGAGQSDHGGVYRGGRGAGEVAGVAARGQRSPAIRAANASAPTASFHLPML